MGLSNAERQARWRAKRDAEIAKLRSAAKAAESSSSDAGMASAQELGEARKEIDGLRQRIRDLETELARERSTNQAAALREQIATLTRERDEAQRQVAHYYGRMLQQEQDVTRLTGDLAASRAVTGLDAKEEQAIAKAVRQRDAAIKDKAKAEARLADDPGENAKLLREIKSLKSTINRQNRANANLREMYDKARVDNPVAITRSDRAKLQKVLYPDTGERATQKQLTEAAQVFGRLKLNIIDEK